MKKERVKSLGSKTFSNRMYTIKIDFYDHNMADATIDLKPWRSGRWHNHQHFCYIPFDECITESMYDYEECLQMLDLDKVARRWFIRQMRHCTEGLLRQDGRPDMDAAERKHDRLSTTYISGRVSRCKPRPRVQDILLIYGPWQCRRRLCWKYWKSSSRSFT